MGDKTVVDVAGGQVGGAARYRVELDRYLAERSHPGLEVVGRNQFLTPDWLLRREVKARSAQRKVAFNNAGFTGPGGFKVTVMQNALHYLTPQEGEQLGPAVPRSTHMQAHIVRWAAKRSDVLVAPCTAMAERVVRVLPEVRDRITVRFNPIAADAFPTAERRAPTILCPIIFHPYKRMDERLAELLDAVDAHGDPEVTVQVTSDRDALPARLAGHPRLVPIGVLPYAELRTVWARSRAIYFPTGIEAFGFPLAEARLSGHPVIARDIPQNQELAGAALCGYELGDLDSLTDAVARAMTLELTPDPAPFDPAEYFGFVLDGR